MSFLNKLQHHFHFVSFFVCLFAHRACGILVPGPQFKLTYPALEGAVLSTWPPGKSLHSCVFSTWFIYPSGGWTYSHHGCGLSQLEPISMWWSHDPNGPITANLVTRPSHAGALSLSYGNSGVWLMAGMQQPFWHCEAQLPENEANPQNQTKPHGSQQTWDGSFWLRQPWKCHTYLNSSSVNQYAPFFSESVCVCFQYIVPFKVIYTEELSLKELYATCLKCWVSSGIEKEREENSPIVGWEIGTNM